MSDLYQVTAECAHVTVDTAFGRAKQLLLKGSVFPGEAPEREHLVAGGMAKRFGATATSAVTPAPSDPNRVADPTTGTVPPPPLSGPGSGRDVWAAYAHTWRVTVPGDATRDQIVQQLRDADIPVESAKP